MDQSAQYFLGVLLVVFPAPSFDDQLDALQQPLAAAAGLDLALDKQGQVCLEGQPKAVGLLLLPLQNIRKTLELKGAQLGEGGAAGRLRTTSR